MGNETFDYLLKRLDLARRVTTPTPWKHEDEKALMLEVATNVRGPLDVPRLERDLKHASQIDRVALSTALGELEELGRLDLPPFMPPLSGTPYYDWRRRLKSLRDLITWLDKPEQEEQVEVQLRLGLVGDNAFEALLECLPVQTPAHHRLAAMVASKLTRLPDDQLPELWRRVLREIDPTSDSHLPSSAPGVTPDFFGKGELATLRPRLARYVVEVRPLLVRAALQGGQETVPMPPIGLASVLSWNNQTTPREWRAEDLAVVRSIGRLSLSLDDEDEKKEFAGALGVVAGGYLVGGRAEQEAARLLKDESHGAGISGRLDELEKLLLVGQAVSTVVPLAIEQALKAYKLGLEVAAQDLTQRFRNRDELGLQRHLLRYLVERDIFAYGTKFGWSESDAVVQERNGLVVIETKLIPVDGKRPSGRTINAWLTQLSSYLDQHRPAARGVLVIYNFGTAPIFCPATPIRHRFFLISVNLCPESPSKRKTALHVEATQHGESLVETFLSGEQKAIKSAPK